MKTKFSNWIVAIVALAAFVVPIEAQLSVKTVSTLADLAASIRPDTRQPFCQVLGWTAANDGGGGLFYWDTASTVTSTNYGAISSARDTSGYWVRMPALALGANAPRTQTLAYNTAIIAESATVQIAAASAITNEAHPSIATNLNKNGQRITIIGPASNSVILRDDGTDSGTKLQLGSTTRTLGALDNITLVYDASAGTWQEVSFTNN